jgi:hypothetical protein
MNFMRQGYMATDGLAMMLLVSAGNRQLQTPGGKPKTDEAVGFQ